MKKACVWILMIGTCLSTMHSCTHTQELSSPIQKNDVGETQWVRDVVRHPTSVEMTWVEIQAGTFMMGAPLNEVDRDDNETPQHPVTLTKNFEMMNTEVTQNQWFDVMGTNPSNFKHRENCADYVEEKGIGLCPNHPVDKVTWNDTQEFIKKINKLREKDGYEYRLPIEAEWEYAARAGSSTAYSFGDNPKNLKNHAWYEDNAEGQTHKVAQLEHNQWRLYDMHGHVWEWVQDWYAPYLASAVTDPKRDKFGSHRVMRGGGIDSFPKDCRSANRFHTDPSFIFDNVGFRLVRTVESQ